MATKKRGVLSGKKILFYGREYDLFSNFSSFAVCLEGKLYPTAEHAYQAAKFLDNQIGEDIRNARSAHDAKKIARAHDLRKRCGWEGIRLNVMEKIIREKVAQHPHVLEVLLRTADREIVEDSPKDAFWGRGPDGKGENNLGKIWMKIRKEIREIEEKKEFLFDNTPFRV